LELDSGNSTKPFRKQTELKQTVFITLLFILLAVSVFLGLSMGSISIKPGHAGAIVTSHLTGQTLPGDIMRTHDIIIWKIRLPRILLALICGSGLALCGAVFQSIFRNPMADPYLLGVSSGASLGAALFLTIPIPFITGSIWGMAAAAFTGSIITTLAVFAAAGRKQRNFTPFLLAGIAVNYIVQAGVSFIMMMNRESADEILFWMMGSFSQANWSKVKLAWIVVILGMTAFSFMTKRISLLSLGSDEAHSLGINPERSGFILLMISCLITGVIVSLCGIIAFAGLVVPHIVRLITGPDYKKLMQASILTGAILMVCADLLARSLMAPSEIPIGVLTSLLGGPFFLYLLKTGSHRRGGFR